MKQATKITALLLSMLLCVGLLAGCGAASDDGEASTGDTSAASSVSTEDSSAEATVTATVDDSDNVSARNVEDDDDNVMTEEQQAYFDEMYATTYNVEAQQAIADELEEKKAADTYTEDNMLIEYDPFSSNTLSLYVYFETEDAVSVTYTVHVENDEIGDFTKTAYQDETYQQEHEFSVIGLIPDTENTVTFTLTAEDGSTETREYTCEVGSLHGNEDVILDKTVTGDLEQISDDLYAILGNDNAAVDFMYFYDVNGVLRSEIPIVSYRAHRLLFDDEGTMFFSISPSRIARMNRLGQIVQLYKLGNYNLHHDYVFDDDGNILVLGTELDSGSIEDRILLIDVDTGEVTELVDLGDIFPDFKADCVENESGDLDWMHINTIQWMGDGSVLLSSRETSTIIKLNNIYDDNTEVDYMIGDAAVWEGYEYADLLLEREGDFVIQGGQHTVTYVEDDSLPEGQYYIYCFNNNIGISQTRPDFDWDSIGLTEDGAYASSDDSYSAYYQYLVDETAGTVTLVDSFEVPYSGYVSSAQNLDGYTIMDSGCAGVMGVYDENHDLIVQYTIKKEKLVYRVFQYDFKGFYFAED